MIDYNYSLSHKFSPPSQGGARGGNSPLEGSPTLVGRGVSPFEGGTGGWPTRLVILIRLRVKKLRPQLFHPPESTLLILPPSKGEIFPNNLED